MLMPFNLKATPVGRQPMYGGGTFSNINCHIHRAGYGDII